MLNCYICNLAMHESYYDHLGFMSRPVCACCALDSTIVGKFAPYSLKRHEKAQLFMNWYINCIFKKYSNHEITVYCDTVVTNIKCALKPDAFIIIQNPNNPRNLAALHIEIDGCKKEKQQMLEKDETMRKCFLDHYSNKRIIYYMTVHIMMGACTPTIERYGLFEIFDATNAILNICMLDAVSVVENTTVRETKRLTGILALNYDVGVHTTYHFTIISDKRYALGRMLDVAYDVNATNLQFIDKSNNSWPAGLVNKDLKGIYAKFKTAWESILKLQEARPDITDYMIIYFGSTFQSYIGLIDVDPASVDKSTSLTTGVKKLNYQNPSHPYWEDEGELVNKVVKNGLRLFQCFWKVGKYRYINLKRFERYNQKTSANPNSVKLEGISQIELRLDNINAIREF